MTRAERVKGEEKRGKKRKERKRVGKITLELNHPSSSCWRTKESEKTGKDDERRRQKLEVFGSRDEEANWTKTKRTRGERGGSWVA